ncbi:MAG: alpha/beta hydrolase [Desulfobacteraceae bacterium]|nr:alpha/beta hydrolase [Desulfobacteraceae bacterium]
MGHEEIKTYFKSDGYLLSGMFHRPADSYFPPVVIGSHGLFSSSESPKQIELAKKCNEKGIAFLRFDHRGCGDSEGKFEEVTSLEGRRNDILSAIDIIRNRSDVSDKIGLFGSSLGGAASIIAAASTPIDTIVTYAAPIRSDTINPSLDGLSNYSRSFIDNLRFNVSDKLSNLKNILIFHCEADDVVPVSSAMEIYSIAENPKEMILFEKGDHPMNDNKHQILFIKEALIWFIKSFQI